MNYIKNDIKFVIIFIIIGFLVGPKIFANQKEKNTLTDPQSNLKAEVVQSSKKSTNPFENMKVVAKSAYVFDISNQQVLYSKDSNTKRPLASLTKMMTAIVALESSNNDDLIKISKEDLETEGNTGLNVDERWSLDKLLELTLVTSSNDGAEAIAASVGGSMDKKLTTRDSMVNAFINRMNQKAIYLGLDSFYFSTPSGLDIGNTPGGVGNAHDVANLFEYTLRKHSSLLQYTALPELSVSTKQNVIHRVSNTNEIASMTPGIIGGKTGFTDLAGGNLAVVVDIGIQHPIVVVVLGSTKEDRFTDVVKLIKATKEAQIN